MEQGIVTFKAYVRENAMCCDLSFLPAFASMLNTMRSLL